MCGIYGITPSNHQVIEKMIGICRHRGPDGEKIYNDEKISIGHNLLSIQDSPTQSLQPWLTPKGNIISYNGEIFNYKELCEKYKSVFMPKTKCDTELLAWGMDNFGYKFIEEIDSMHAFAYYKKNEQELMLSVDHLSIKPLYYSTYNNELIFSSEIKNMLENVPGSRSISSEGLACYTWCGMNVLDQTIFNHIKKLTAGETIIYDLQKKKIKQRYYQRIKPTLDNKFNAEEFRYQVKKTVALTSIGIRNFGIFLSGGLDSSVIAYEMNKINPNVKTFTNRFFLDNDQLAIGYNSDADVAKILAQQENFKHQEVLITPDTLTEQWINSSKANEECILNPSNFVYYYTNKIMKENNITVTMAGDMGDELLTGYYNHINFLEKHKVKNDSDFIKYFSTLNSGSPFKKSSKFPREEIIKKFKQLYVDNFWNDADPLTSYMAIECLTVVPNEFLKRNDKFGMSQSIEGRFPFTTKSFMKYCFSIPSNEKCNLQTRELKLLSKIAYKDILPKQLLNKDKTGWTAPFGYWLSNNENLKKVFSKHMGSTVPKHTGAKTYKKMFRDWMFNSWKQNYNII